MTRYRISQGGEPVAIVTSLNLALGVARGQPPGYYSVEEFWVDRPYDGVRSATRAVADPAPDRVGSRKLANHRRGAPRRRPRA